MPTKFTRVPVTKDHALSEALSRVAPLVGDVKTATLVHDLAIRGAEALAAEHARRARLLERLAERSVRPDPGFDRDVLGRIDRDAWER